MRRTCCLPLYSVVSLPVLLLIAVAPAAAQKTVTRDAGGGRKIVLHYNAAGKVIETDTLGPNGELLEKDMVEYKASAYIPQTTSTSYWPNGRPHKITESTYDDNSNFTGEFVQVFDEAGKQIGGHRLARVPQTNLYSCSEWNLEAQSYKPVECPENEESSGTPETAEKFTRQQVRQQLERAHQAAPKPPAAAAAAGAAASAATNVREVGLILPSHIRAGERISGRVVDNPADYEGMPQITVTRFALPFSGTGKDSTLAGWTVQMSGEPPQAADGPIELNVPPGQVELAVMFRAADREGAPVSKGIPIAPGENPGKASTAYLAPATCIKGQLCTVQGPFSGNSSKAFAAFLDQPAKIVAETTTAMYLAIPDAIEPGPRPLAISEGSKAIAFPMVVSKLGLRPDRRNLPQGEQLLMYVTVDGPEEIPEEEWRPGNFPPWSLDEARKLVPGYEGSRSGHADHEAEEKREKAEHSGEKTEAEEDSGGEILVVVKNTTPEVMNFRESQDGGYVFHLHASSFKMGEFKYEFVVEAKNAGTFGVQSFMIPLLAPVEGQVFSMTADAP